MTLFDLVLGISGLAFFLFSFAWIVARRIDNYSIVDALWSLSFGLFALPILLFAPGDPTRKLLYGGMFVVWSFRLGTFLTVRIFSHLDREDTRYKKLREEYGKHVAFRFYLFFFYQAISVVLLLGPLFVVAMNPAAGLSPIEITGALVWFVGLIGEATADSQMSKFRSDPANAGQVCERGLWYYSRHPNYFFECTIWLGYALFALGSPGGWITLYAPATLWLLILKVTGVPMAEKTSLKTRGDRYREYQRTTSVVIPLPKRKV
jgi:steroid 5-alpha reductase family enzyme